MRMAKNAKIIYCGVFFLLLLLPGVFTFIGKKQTIGNETQAEISEANYLNLSEQIDDYLSAGFGFRSELIQLHNNLFYYLFQESGEDSVIAGKDGWLFYESALHDYTGEDVLSEAEIEEIVAGLQRAYDAATAQGVDFLFVSAPNKMEIYGSYMPYYLEEDTDAGNYELLMEALDRTDIPHVDLKAVLQQAAKESEQPLYHKLDSHWNNLGAAAAYQAMMETVGYPYTDYAGMAYTVLSDFEGDLYGMLFPQGEKRDEQFYYANGEQFEYTSVFRSVDDLKITTENAQGSYSVLLYRDSFGNALYPFFANDFAAALISREVPYDLTDLTDTDLIVIEIAERNIPNLLTYLPITE